ncbi:MAG: hypothetical protein ABI607_09620 [Betaproteobacteria bacterium]
MLRGHAQHEFGRRGATAPVALGEVEQEHGKALLGAASGAAGRAAFAVALAPIQRRLNVLANMMLLLRAIPLVAHGARGVLRAGDAGFGVGILPNVLAAGWTLARSERWFADRRLCFAGAAVITGFAVLCLYRARESRMRKCAS